MLKLSRASLLLSAQDPNVQTSLITRPTDRVMNVNIPYADVRLVSLRGRSGDVGKSLQLMRSFSVGM